MPSHYKKKRYVSKRPGYRSCGRMVVSDATKALYLAKKLKTMINVEYNSLENSTSSSIGIASTRDQLCNKKQRIRIRIQI